MDGRVKPGNEEAGVARNNAESRASFDLTPPLIVARGLSLAETEGWQMLAKKLVHAAGHPPRCHKRRCRRSGECGGGKDACYIREFEAIDVAMQRYVLPAILRASRGVAE